MEANRIFPKIIQHMKVIIKKRDVFAKTFASNRLLYELITFKKRHSQGSNYSYALSLEEILEELNQNDVSTKVRALLDNEVFI